MYYFQFEHTHMHPGDIHIHVEKEKMVFSSINLYKKKKPKIFEHI